MTHEPVESGRRPVVFLLHGLGRTCRSMRRLQQALASSGFETRPWGYSSFRGSIRAHAMRLRRDVDALAPHPVHFLTHSMGGIIVRTMLCDGVPSHVGRVVMLAPPNQGSSVARRLAPLLGWCIGAMYELSDGPTSFVRQLAVPKDVCIGIVAARRDGKVQIADTHLACEADHAVVPGRHTFIMNRRDVAELAVRFLRTGRFTQAMREHETAAGASTDGLLGKD